MTTQKTTSVKLAQSMAKMANSQVGAAKLKAKNPVARKTRATARTPASRAQKTIDATPMRSNAFQSTSRVWPD